MVAQRSSPAARAALCASRRRSTYLISGGNVLTTASPPRTSAPFPFITPSTYHLTPHRFTVTATHKGSLAGEQPTGKTVTFHCLDCIHVRNGKATDIWHYGDEMTVFPQLGIQPTPTS